MTIKDSLVTRLQCQGLHICICEGIVTFSKTLECQSWEHFNKTVRNNEEGRVVGSRIYRGHADPSWALASKFERWLEQKRGNDRARSTRELLGPNGPEAFEESYLRAFKAFAVGLQGIQTNDLNEDEWWALGRHHGLITRLLDWSYSPYVAAFFAFVDHAARSMPGFSDGLPEKIGFDSTSHVSVWALAPFRDLEIDREFEILQPRRDQFLRQRAQAGLYTRLRHDLYLDLASYLEAKQVGHYLEEIRIPCGEIGKALYDLKLMNITYSTLFPDLDGAARDANLATVISGLGFSGVVVNLST